MAIIINKETGKSYEVDNEALEDIQANIELQDKYWIGEEGTPIPFWPPIGEVKAFQPLEDGATITQNVRFGLNGSVTLAGNRTLNIIQMKDGYTGQIFVKQDGTGSRTLSLPAGSKVFGNGAGSIVLSTGANKIDKLDYTMKDGILYFTLTKDAS